MELQVKDKTFKIEKLKLDDGFHMCVYVSFLVDDKYMFLRNIMNEINEFKFIYDDGDIRVATGYVCSYTTLYLSDYAEVEICVHKILKNHKRTENIDNLDKIIETLEHIGNRIAIIEAKINSDRYVIIDGEKYRCLHWEYEEHSKKHK
jgi:hypothetical protein